MGKIAAMKAEILGRLAKKPETELYPFEKTEMPEGWRGAIEFDYECCIMCSICARVCPAEAIEMKPVSEKKNAPLFYQDRCIYCGQCAESCPKDCITLTKEYETASPKRELMRVDKLKEKRALLEKQEKAKAAKAAEKE